MNDALLVFVSPLLQITFRAKEYRALLQKYSRGSTFSPSRAGDDYWSRVPQYLVSRCPFCAAAFTSRLDTHSLLAGWQTSPERWSRVQLEEYQTIGCDHFTAVQTFVNLNGLVPTEVDYYENRLDVPFVMPVFVPDDSPAIAVIHSLPICRLEQEQLVPLLGIVREQFVPRYLAIFVTYYARNPKELRLRRSNAVRREGRGDPEYQGTSLYSSGDAKHQPQTYDLRSWVDRGKLRWIDPSSLQLAAPSAPFPYEAIQGYRHPVLVKDGQLTRVL